MIPEHATIFKDMNLPRRPLSRLSYQIMGLNLIAVAILIMGIFYLDSYRENLTISETELLATESELYATILGNSAKSLTLNQKTTQQIIDAFSRQKTQRLRVFKINAALIADTNQLLSMNKNIVSANKIPNFLNSMFQYYKDITSINFKLPLYDDQAVLESIKNASTTVSAWQDMDGKLILSSISPIYNNGTMIGFLVTTRFDTNIARTFEAMRMDVFLLFVVSLFITLAFSLYLSANIGHPLRFLASAAEASRLQHRKKLIPDLSYRKDEIGDLSTSLIAMTESLVNRMNSIEEFAADVAHELKNPLTSIKSAFETLDKAKDSNQKQALINIIDHDLHRMDRLITSISNASRLDAELARKESAPISLSDIFAILESHYSQLNKQLILHIHSDIPYIWGNQSHILQVFYNIIDNGFSFGNKVELSLYDHKEMIEIICRDNGKGISTGSEAKIFERFYSDREHQKNFGFHSGLGLSIARQILISHGGSVRVNPDYKNGAEFIISLRKATLL